MADSYTLIGGTFADWVAAPFQMPFGDPRYDRSPEQVAAFPPEPVTLTVWDAATGERIDDLMIDDQPVTTITTGTNGFVPEFGYPSHLDPPPLVSADGGSTRHRLARAGPPGVGGEAAVAAHVAVDDPHPQYLREADYTPPEPAPGWLLTDIGDLLVGGPDGPRRLPRGQTGQVPTIQADGSLAYAAPTPDTRERDVSGLLTAGLAKSATGGVASLRRWGPICFATFHLDITASGITSLIGSLPAGFGTAYMWSKPGSAHTHPSLNRAIPDRITDWYLAPSGFRFTSALPNPGTLMLDAQWRTDSPWPATLPGVPA